MTKSRRSLILDSSHFRDIRVGKASNFFFDEEETFYEKGRKKDPKVRFEGKDKIVLSGKKGEADIEIDLGNARKITRKLRDHHATDNISDLRGDVKEKFLSLHDLVEVLSNTPAYRYLHEMITSEFRCADEHRYRIGTVGAYFCECQQPSDFPGNQSCSLGCLLGLHPEGGCKGYYPCEYTCVIYNGDQSLTVVHRVMDTKQAYIFVNDKFNFYGLTNTEITKLESMGIEEVKVVKHSDGLSYQEISSDFIPCHNLRIAAAPVKRGNSNAKGDFAGHNNYCGAAAAAVLIVLLLIILIGGGYYYYKRGQYE